MQRVCIHQRKNRTCNKIMFKEGNMFCRFAKRFWWRQDNLSSLLPFAKRSWSLVRQKEPSCELNTKKHPPCISYDTPASTTSSSDGENPSLWAGFRAMDSAAHQIHRFLQCSLSEVQVSSLGFSFGLVIRFEPQPLAHSQLCQNTWCNRAQ